MSLSAARFRRAHLAIATLFFALGINYGTWAARIPALKQQLQMNDAEVGIFLLASGLGAVFSFPLTAWILQRFGTRTACLLAAGGLPLVLLLLAGVSNYPAGVSIMVFEGVLASCLNVAMNTQAVELEAQSGRMVMSRLHAIFSLGLFSAALLAWLVQSITPLLWQHFVLAAVLLISAAIYAAGGLLPTRPAAEEPGSQGRRFALPAGAALGFGVLAFCGTIVEGSMNDWTALYLKEVAGASERAAVTGLAAFSATMLISRWFGDAWRLRFGARKLLLGGGLLTGLALLLGVGLAGFWPGVLAFALAGLGMAAVSPCVYQGAARHGAITLAAVTTMGSIGALLGPPLLGFVAHASSLAWAMAIVAVMALLIALLSRSVRW
ncbi:MFS transporter [Chitinilyticum piscinae]|uniref:MFS transporter n=1 Tax=Chitinilyticum piscinae TaxID=2866724 RepID=A0A8J7K178_9NEIS|nr:MFS transporter [Chitinilyticum piscinae]MBE9608831.1 MFS transporter [Chitinilyticum piscinae]